MSLQNSLSSEEQDSCKDSNYYPEDKACSIDGNKEEESLNSQLIKVEINIGDGIIKELNIYSMDDIEKSIIDFCKENNLPEEAKKPIKNLLMQELNKKIAQCKLYLYIRFSRKY